MSAGLAQQVATSSQTGTWERARGSGPIPKLLFFIFIFIIGQLMHTKINF
jgi:hypothetical protein